MSDGIVITPIARVRSDFGGKFGIPRQSGVVPELSATVVFEPAYREAEALRGIEGFSHLWLIWGFSENFGKPWSPLVRPPRLGGNTRMGVFATRAPVRPNPLGLSCVKLESVDLSTPEGPVLRISGADLMDGTPDFRHQALRPLLGRPGGRARRLHRRRMGALARRGDTVRARGAFPGGKARRPHGRAGAGPAPGLSARPGPHLRHDFRRI